MHDVFAGRSWFLMLPLLIGMAMTMRASAAEDALASLQAAAGRVARITFDNGMVGLIHEDHSAPVVAVQIWVGTGSIHEHEYLGGGLSHYVEHMIFKGTERRAIGAIAREIDEAGGRVNAYTSFDRTVFHVVLPSARWETGIDVLFDAVMNANFPTNEYAREKEVIIREMAMGQDNPDIVLNHLLFRTAYAVHPYRFPIIGMPDIFRSLTRDDLLTFFHRNYVSDNMTVVVVGDISRDTVEARLRAMCATFPRRPRAPLTLPAEPPQLAPRSDRIAGPYQVSRAIVAYHTVEFTHSDAPALDLLAAIVGRGRSSRLVDDIKEKRQLVHAIDAWSFTGADRGMFGVSATFAPERETEFLAAVESQIKSWIATPFTKAEFEKARRQFLAGEVADLQTMDGLAGKFGAGEFYAHDPRFSPAYLAQIETLQPKDVQAVAARYLSPNNRTIAILCPSNTATAEPLPAAVMPAPVQRRTLPDGATLLLREDHRLPLVHFSVVFNGGVLYEKESNNGITRLMAELLKAGTTTRSAEQIARQVESLGADLNSFSGLNSFGLQGQCLASDAEELLSIMADCLTDPVFPAEEVAKEKTVQIAAIAEQLEQPMAIAQRALLTKLFPDHPYRFDPLGTPATVSGMSTNDLADFHRRLVVKGNMVISVFGDIDPSDTINLVARTMRAMRKDGPLARECPAPNPVLPSETILHEPRQQAIVLAGFPAPDLRDPRRDALTVLETAMRGMSSALFREIREKRGLAYYTGASLRPGVDTGYFMLFAGTHADAVPEVRRLFSEELTRIVRDGLTDAELDRARNQLIAGQAMSLQANGSLAMSCALNEMYGLGFEYDFGIPSRIAAVTRDQVRAAAASIISTNREAVVVVLPVNK